MLGDGHAGVALGIQQLPERGFFGVLGAGRVARRGADALVLLVDQGVVVERFAGGIAPQLGAHALVQALGERLRQAVGQGLEQDGAVVVVRRLETRHVRIDADAGGAGERAQPVRHAAVAWREVIGEAQVRHAGRFFLLLAQVVQRGQHRAARVVGVQLDVVADGVGRKQADHRAGAQPALVHDASQHGLRVAQQLARLLADHGVVQNLRVAAGQLPGLEERRPVDAGKQFGQIDGI